MHRLLEFPVADSVAISELRKTLDTEEQRVALGLALARAGCSLEASYYLRPTRKTWSGGPDADDAKMALAAQTWWNKTWRDIARAMQSGRAEAALELIGDNSINLWDQPALLLHLGSIARDRNELALAEHLLQRVVYLAERGLPKTEMSAFEYVARAGLIDVLAASGNLADALVEYDVLSPNQGNAMAHELQGARLLALAGHDEAAMAALAAILVTARATRKGYGREIREDFVAMAPELAKLRDRPDWAELMDDPAGYSKQFAR
ncbi:MAG: hypothetical protein ACR2OY_11965 [Boseongicola sp.]